MKQVLELLDVPDLKYDGFHDVVIEQRFRGMLPRDKEKLLAKVDKAIAYWETQPPVLCTFE